MGRRVSPKPPHTHQSLSLTSLQSPSIFLGCSPRPPRASSSSLSSLLFPHPFLSFLFPLLCFDSSPHGIKSQSRNKIAGFSSIMCFHTIYILSVAPAYLHHSSTKWSTCKNWHQKANKFCRRIAVPPQCQTGFLHDYGTIQ